MIYVLQNDVPQLDFAFRGCVSRGCCSVSFRKPAFWGATVEGISVEMRSKGEVETCRKELLRKFGFAAKTVYDPGLCGAQLFA